MRVAERRGAEGAAAHAGLMLRLRVGRLAGHAVGGGGAGDGRSLAAYDAVEQLEAANRRQKVVLHGAAAAASFLPNLRGGRVATVILGWLVGFICRLPLGEMDLSK